MVVLDTDIVTLLQRRDAPQYRAIDARMRARAEAYYTSIVTVEEQMRGWLAAIASSRTEAAEIKSYSRLLNLIVYFKDRPLLGFDENASVIFRNLRSSGLRVGTMDLRIAAIAMANDALLVSRNLADFMKIPGLRVEDWTRPL